MIILLSSIPVIKKLSHLPIIVDPSHAGGQKYLIEPLSKAAIAIDCDGLIIEVHNHPEKALSDGEQSITPTMYNELCQNIRPLVEILNKKL